MELTRGSDLKLSRLGLHALHALAHLAEHPDRLVTAHAIAAARGIPEPTLKRIVLKPLVTARLLLSNKGPTGGYRLAKPAKDVTLLEIVEAIDGPIRGEAPPVLGGEAAARLDARLQKVCDQAAELVRQNLGKAKMLDFMKKR